MFTFLALRGIELVYTLNIPIHIEMVYTLNIPIRRLCCPIVVSICNIL